MIRRFERIYNLMECKPYIKNEDNPENKEIFVHGSKHTETDKLDNYILIGCESDELYENEIPFNFWSNNFIKKEIEKNEFKITGWSFIALVKTTNFNKIRRNVFSRIQLPNQECDVVLFNWCLPLKFFIWVCDFRWLLYYLSIANLSQTWHYILYSPSSLQHIFSSLSLSIFIWLKLFQSILYSTDSAL